MILHLCVDDKFIDYAINSFEKVIPSENKFLVVVSNTEYKLKWIKQIDKVECIIDTEISIDRILNELPKYKAIIFHSLFLQFFLELINRINSIEIKLIWSFWGGEFYDNPQICAKYIGNLTYLKFMYGFLRGKIGDYIHDKDNKRIKKSVKKITHIIANEEDSNIINREWGGNMNRIEWYYFSIEETVGKKLIDKTTKDNNILIGNSATFSNNHLEIFKKLKKFDLNNKKIIVPLSYGTEKDKYGKYIAKVGYNIWRNNFIPLITFLEREQYNQYILDCGIVIFNHYRQQAFGNIITSIWLGSKVYMSERNPLYKNFVSEGLIIFSIEKDLNKNNPEVFELLSDEQRKINRILLYKKLSKGNVFQLTQKLVGIIYD